MRNYGLCATYLFLTKYNFPITCVFIMKAHVKGKLFCKIAALCYFCVLTVSSASKAQLYEDQEKILRAENGKYSNLKH